MTTSDITNALHGLATSPDLSPTDQLRAWDQLSTFLTATSPTAVGVKPKKPEPVLGMEEAYKAYLENITFREQVPRRTPDDPIEYTSRGLVAKSKLTQLRSTHPELFL